MRKPKKLLLFIEVLALVIGLCLITASAEEAYITLDNDKAAVTGTGFADEKEAATVYDASLGYVINLGSGSSVTYTVEVNVTGSVDVYLEVSRAAMALGTTPLSISVNGGPETVPIIEYGFSQNADYADMYEKGVFLCLKNISLKIGDMITVTALPGFVFGTASFLPSIGDIRLYNTGTKVAVGYDHVIPTELAKDTTDPLSGLQLIWLGSSVTYGQGAQGYSMADYLEDSHQALKSYKFAISGTTLVDDSPSSYISRMKKIPTDIRPDYFIVQLSTNDAALGKPFGSLSGTMNLNDFDTKTIYGAMEYVIAYASKTWNCPVMFYTGTYYDESTYNNDGTAYAQMVTALLDVQNKWGIHVIDLYNDKAMSAIYNSEQWQQYMSDGVHPKTEGYKTWWGPKFEQAMTTLITAEDTVANVPSNAVTDLDNDMTVWWAIVTGLGLMAVALIVYYRRKKHKS